MGQSADSGSTPAGGAILHRLFAIDPRALAALRIALAFLLLADLGLRALDFSTFYTDSGLLPFRVALNHVVPLHALSGAYLYQAVLFGAAAVFASLLLLGLHTRLATITSWVMLVSLDTQNAIVGFYGDEILRLVLFWCMFVPLGRVWSLDARRAKAKDVASRDPILSFGTAGLLLQIAIVYLFSGLLKTGPDWWENGLGIPIALSRDWLVKPFGVHLAQVVDLNLLKGLSFLVLGFEILGPLLLFLPIATSRIRVVLVPLSWFFQVLLGLSFFLVLMPWTVSAVMLPFLPQVFWDRFEGLSTRFQTNRGAATSSEARQVRRPLAGRISEALAFVFLLWIIAYNVVGLRDEQDFPEPLRIAGQWLRIEQKWAMFSPVSPREDGWYVIVGELQNGSFVNLWWTGPKLSWDKPQSISSHHRSASWSTYEMRLTEPIFDRPEFAHFRRRYAEWHCKRWNANHSDGEALVQLEVFFVDETTQADLSPPTPRPRSLQFLRCTDGNYAVLKGAPKI